MTVSLEQFLTTELNPSQKDAVLQLNSSLLIIAGAGSGKTRVITAKIAYLLQVVGLSPHAIVALTFTNKAAREMKERVATFTEHKILPFIGTFHGYCLLLLKKYYKDAPFTILDSDDQEKLIKQILEKMNKKKEYSARTIMHQLSLVRNHYAYGTEQDYTAVWENRVLAEIYRAYEQEKKQCRYFDFDDLLIETVRILRSDRSFKEQLSQGIEYILVDEYQDTNVIQHALITLLSKKSDTHTTYVCVVGDGDQSIYSWRGATVKNIQSFANDFPGCMLIKIEQNYRSVQHILDIANHLIEHNTQRTPKLLWSHKKVMHRALHLICKSEYQEADTIIAAIALYQKNNYTAECAVLYRTHSQSRALEEACIKQGIAYRIIGGIQFYERAEIKDMLAYVKLVVNPFDRISFFRVLNIPARGLGPKCEELFHALWNEQPFLNVYELIEKVIQEQLLPTSKLHTLKQFLAFFEGLEGTISAHTVMEAIIRRTGYTEYLYATYEKENARERIENIKELLSAALYFEQQGIVSTIKFLEEIALFNEKIITSNESHHTIVLMTLHAAKGLEFDFVCIAGVEEQIIPTPRSFDNPYDIEEERRLLYVGITRAKEHLMISSCKSRFFFGTPARQTSSRFLDEIPSTLLPAVDCAYWTTERTLYTVQQWMKGILVQPTSVSKNIDHYKTETPVKKNDSSFEPQNTQNQKKGPSFAVHQKVKHTLYGIGTIQQIDQKNATDFYAKVRFISGIKTILTKFLESA